MVPKLEEAAIELKELLRPESEEDANVVQKGLMLYRQGLVHHLKFVGGTVWATVQDVTPVKVFVSLPNPADSTCTCPYGDFCRHQMAAFLAAYGLEHRVEDWVDEWRRPLKESRKAEEQGLEKAKELVSHEQNGYQLWAAHFERNFNEILHVGGKPTPYVITSLMQTYLRAVKAAAPQAREWSLLYQLVGLFYGFKGLAALSCELDHSSQTIDRYYRYLFEHLLEEMEDSISSLSVHSIPFDFDPYVESLKEETAELGATEDFAYERASMYRMLWSQLLKNPRWREDEIIRLEAFGEGKRTIVEEVALAHQYYLARRDTEAIGLIKNVSLAYLLYWIEELTKHREIGRLQEYIDYLSHHLRTALNGMKGPRTARDFTRLVFRKTAPYFRDSGRDDQYERLLIQTMPYSFIEYEDFLFFKGHYEKWSELYTYANFDSFSVPNDKVKIVQKENPEVLLPILHQAVDTLIQQKNRQSYKQAARHLKKLRTIYKKLKRVPEWESFLDQLLDRYKRLRAFREECVRAKLIPS